MKITIFTLIGMIRLIGFNIQDIQIGNLVEISIPKKFLSVLHTNLVSSPIKGIVV
jgi:hypothetical protein